MLKRLSKDTRLTRARPMKNTTMAARRVKIRFSSIAFTLITPYAIIATITGPQAVNRMLPMA